MKVAFSIFIVTLLISFSSYSVSACTCVSLPLEKRLKEASAVFIGRVSDKEPENNVMIQNYSASNKFLQTLEVVKSWKGVKKEFVAVNFDQTNLGASCPTLYRFEEDKEYLVFAYGKELNVTMVCSDTQPISSAYNSITQREIRKLNSFSFKFWSSINIF